MTGTQPDPNDMANIRIPVEEEAIFITDSTGSATYLIYMGGEDYNCVKSYTIYGGCAQPFEYIKLQISKKQLSVLAPYVADSIRVGRNKIIVFGPGRGEYILTSCKKSGDTWTLIAYITSEQLRGMTLATPLDFSASAGAGGAGEVSPNPFTLLTSLILPAASSLSQSMSDEGLNYNEQLISGIYAIFRTENNSWVSHAIRNDQDQITGYSHPKSFGEGTSVWYVASVCALKLGCKMWLSGTHLYIIDTTITKEELDAEAAAAAAAAAAGASYTPTISIYGEESFTDLETVYLNSKDGVFPLNPTEAQTLLMENVIDQPSYSAEGSEVLRNTVEISYGGIGGGSVTSSKGDGTGFLGEVLSKSREIFGRKSISFTIKEMDEDNARAIAENIARRYCDAEDTISFAVREVVEELVEGATERVWYSTFGPLTRIKSIVDYSEDVVISVRDNFQLGYELMHKGMLTSYERTFPQHITKYTFGISTPTDITQNNSMIKNAIDNG